MEGRKSVANNSSTTSAVKVPTTYVSPFSKPLQPPIIPKQLPHTIANNSSTTSAVKVPTTYVSPFSKPLQPPIIPKQLPHTIANNSSTTSAVKVPTTYVSPFSKPLQPPIIPKQLPHTIANKLSNNSRHSTQENTIQTNETTDTVVPDTTGQVLQSSPIANQLSNNSRQSTQENTIQTNETTDTVVPDTTGQVLQSSPIANQLSNNSRQSTQENTIQTNETTEEQPSASSMTTRSQMRYLAFAKQFQSGDTENTEENTTIPERVRRQYAKKRLQLLEKLKNQWGIQDDTDYSEVFQSVMDSLQPVENEVKDPGVLVDLFVQYLP
ncbi:attachment subunit-related family, partial [Trichomonas vaginalis G3]|uniref:attachment subunit-related family n=1 Tax=Trichomonas vaginalis (strain ATCC PRA-98 / G3) TaxID=412133 RepID=UPI0021E5E8FA